VVVPFGLPSLGSVLQRLFDCAFNASVCSAFTRLFSMVDSSLHLDGHYHAGSARSASFLRVLLRTFAISGWCILRVFGILSSWFCVPAHLPLLPLPRFTHTPTPTHPDPTLVVRVVNWRDSVTTNPSRGLAATPLRQFQRPIPRFRFPLRDALPSRPFYYVCRWAGSMYVLTDVSFVLNNQQ
jgi:hypothetical protein